MADASASQEFLQSLCDSHLVCAPVQGQQLQWQTSPKLCLAGEQFSPAAFLQINELLLANPNFNSSHVFRADILCDSAGQLQSPAQAEAASLSSSVRATNGCQTADVDADANADSNSATDLDDAATHVRPLDPFEFAGLTLSRTVVRRFIPRKQKLDRALNQTCDFYESRNEPGPGPGSEPQALQSLPPVRTDYLVVLRPHVSVPSQMPWYHPAIQAVAFLYRYSEAARSETSPEGNLSVHFLPFPGLPTSLRLERTLLSLLNTQARLARKPLRQAGLRTNETETRTPKDNILPRHVVQNRYAALKERYAPWLMRNWVESTEPAKHVFEDLSIAAFLCELWQRHYHAGTETDARDHAGKRPWPGFVDIACGNGVLVYILHQEGFEGWGFDARRRKTWSILPQATQARLREMIYFPQPFRAVAESADGGAALADPVFDGILTRETFIISNHADELTLWTPIIGALSDPACPMPFLAIPCCSHSLSGARYRYPPPKHVVPVKVEQDNPVTGDLKAMAAERRQERADPGVGYSAYASLTARLVRIAQEVGYDDVDRTLLRIPSTRNIAVVAGVITRPQRQVRDACQARAEMEEKVHDILAADCQRNGGVETAAQAWLNRALSLQQPGRSQQSAKALG